MMLHKILMVILLCFSISPCFAERKPSIDDFIGKWTVYDVVGYSEISAGVPEAKRLLGKVMTIAKNRIDFDDEKCTPEGGFVVDVVDTSSKFDENYGKFYIPDLGLSPRSILLDSENCMPVFKLRDNVIVFGQDGVIFRAYK